MLNALLREYWFIKQFHFHAKFPRACVVTLRTAVLIVLFTFFARTQ